MTWALNGKNMTKVLENGQQLNLYEGGVNLIFPYMAVAWQSSRDTQPNCGVKPHHADKNTQGIRKRVPPITPNRCALNGILKASVIDSNVNSPINATTVGGSTRERTASS